MPKRFYDERNISMITLLRESGYYKFYKEIDPIDILQVLTELRECIKYWITWSENKRTSSGWYIINRNNKYIVGFYPENKNSKLEEYDNEAEACANFIKKEIEAMRNY